jgi:gamma-glutamyltranspeptidase / glutathione hydrolase
LPEGGSLGVADPRRLNAAAIGELPLNWPAGLVGP